MYVERSTAGQFLLVFFCSFARTLRGVLSFHFLFVPVQHGYCRYNNEMCVLMFIANYGKYEMNLNNILIIILMRCKP